MPQTDEYARTANLAFDAGWTLHYAEDREAPFRFVLVRCARREGFITLADARAFLKSRSVDAMLS